jgi:sortase B
MGAQKADRVSNRPLRTSPLRASLLALVLVALVGVLAVSSHQIYRYYAEGRHAAQQFGELAQLIRTPEQVEPPAGAGVPKPVENGAEQTQAEDDAEQAQAAAYAQAVAAYEKYATLFEQNADMVGWIRIDGTPVNYPVTQTPECPDFYLKRDFEEKPSNYGVPYAVEDCDVLLPSDNITIYGHRMKNGTMFGSLDEYKAESFYREHLLIHFDTRAGFGDYVILAVPITTPGEFAYDRFVQTEDAAAFAEYVERCRSLALYDTSVTAAYGDKLLTLSTCEYSEESGRLVVVAKRMIG